MNVPDPLRFEGQPDTCYLPRIVEPETVYRSVFSWYSNNYRTTGFQKLRPLLDGFSWMRKQDQGNFTRDEVRIIFLSDTLYRVGII